MKSRTTKQFRKRLKRLPDDIQEQAKAAYQLFKKNPYDPSLQFSVLTLKSLFGQHASVIAIEQ